MSRDWEETFKSWSKPPSDTEDQKCQNAETMVRAAIKQSDTFTGRNVEIFSQGSYANNTNVRLDSDVDICVRYLDTFFYDLPNGLTKEEVGITDATYHFSQFKDDVEAALVDKFGRSAIKRGNKAFDIHENTYRVDADVVACFEYKLFRQNSSGKYNYISGTKFIADDGRETINWPRQNYENGVSKNSATGNRFKYIVRGLKRLRNEMAENGVAAATSIPSYLIECLVWNVPNNSLGHTNYLDDIRSVLAHTFNSTMTQEKCNEWGEVNEIKYLFRGTQPWTLGQSHNFLGAAWDYIGFN